MIQKTSAKDTKFLELDSGMYIGDVRDGIPNGFGMMIYNDKFNRKMHIGHWRDGVSWGPGVSTYHNGFVEAYRHEAGRRSGPLLGAWELNPQEDVGSELSSLAGR